MADPFIQKIIDKLKTDPDFKYYMRSVLGNSSDPNLADYPNQNPNNLNLETMILSQETLDKYLPVDGDVSEENIAALIQEVGEDYMERIEQKNPSQFTLGEAYSTGKEKFNEYIVKGFEQWKADQAAVLSASASILAVTDMDADSFFNDMSKLTEWERKKIWDDALAKNPNIILSVVKERPEAALYGADIRQAFIAGDFKKLKLGVGSLSESTQQAIFSAIDKERVEVAPRKEQETAKAMKGTDFERALVDEISPLSVGPDARLQEKMTEFMEKFKKLSDSEAVTFFKEMRSVGYRFNSSADFLRFAARDSFSFLDVANKALEKAKPPLFTDEKEPVSAKTDGKPTPNQTFNAVTSPFTSSSLRVELASKLETRMNDIKEIIKRDPDYDSAAFPDAEIERGVRRVINALRNNDGVAGANAFEAIKGLSPKTQQMLSNLVNEEINNLGKENAPNGFKAKPFVW